MSDGQHAALLGLLSRRQVLVRASGLVMGLVGLPSLPGLPIPGTPSTADATLQAFADTILPGAKTTRTDLGHPIDPLAIAGVDSRPGAVQADALALYHHPEIGFDALEPAFLAELEARSLPHGGDFLHLGFAARVQACLSGLDFANPSRVMWEAAAAVPFTAFCAAALIHNAAAAEACGYRVMGLPGTAPAGYRDYSFGRALSRERTRTGSLP